ncbi:carbohydrate esterase family 9 protein [Punctularia strigosozonata HHB-11173 SS5]|uniref:carbohydrate esterase family 9 protein n=1 Tax=Punctularia strigosozonata (strain HHB-11173) TaxID=741275 RepID=UPI000441852E|nr:carbohydrate esterase family 9 protein [Punctularia strigosozonata HHB-11173 SS5]EIN06427.1 carbohydrate esterase family 9 protein [Punctularia strigosozonata HHB-11173 SS5]
MAMAYAALPMGTPGPARQVRSHSWSTKIGVALLSAFALASLFKNITLDSSRASQELPLHAEETLARCRVLHVKPAAPTEKRTVSDRYVPGEARPVLIKNATIWTGGNGGAEIIKGDVLLEKGLVKTVGRIDTETLAAYSDYATVDARGSWITPGIVDLHSHVGVEPHPALSGATDGNSLHGPILPYLRAVDALNTHDEGFRLAVAGGVTTSLVLPGSANAIGGQGILMKLRPTKERTPTSMLLEPPFSLNGSDVDLHLPPRWRHMKHACGENPRGVYGQTRMDTTWQWRKAYDKARQIKNAQDDYCLKVSDGDWTSIGSKSFPEDLEYEALVDILRGKVKVQTHCYEAVDFGEFVRLSNEFKFPVAAFHHAHEAWIVPDLLKSAYEHPPAIAMFASFSGYKREAYRHTVFAPRILANEGIEVVMKSDAPAIVSRYLMHEAQQAHYYGLPESIALRSVITTPAKVLGVDHRIGYIEEGYDADVVVWDSHPLQLGATPFQVFIDGIPQISVPHLSPKADSQQQPPKTPDFSEDVARDIRYEGHPPLAPQSSKSNSGLVVFQNISSMWMSEEGKIVPVFKVETPSSAVLAIRNGKIVCKSTTDGCASFLSEPGSHHVNLRGGSVAPALVSVGTALGLAEIPMEPSTTDGPLPDSLQGDVPSILGDLPVIRAADGFQAHTRDALLAWRSGVTKSITAPMSDGAAFLQGLSTVIDLGASVNQKPILQDIAALHVSISHNVLASVSTQIAVLRRLLTEKVPGEAGKWFRKAAQGSIPLVVNVDSADIISTLLRLKADVEDSSGRALKLTLLGAAEAHLLAREIAEAGVGVILTPPRQFPYGWEQRRILPGPPLSAESAITRLFRHNVTLGIGHQGIGNVQAMNNWAARNARWDAAWAAFDSNGTITKADALALVSTNIEKLLGSHGDSIGDMVATESGELLDFEGKVVAVLSPTRGVVDLL